MSWLRCPWCGKSARLSSGATDLEDDEVDEIDVRRLGLTPCEHCGKPPGEMPESWRPQSGTKCWVFLTPKTRCARDGVYPWANKWIANGRICPEHAAALNMVARATERQARISDDFAVQMFELPSELKAALMRAGSATNEVVTYLLWRNAAQRMMEGGGEYNKPGRGGRLYVKVSWVERRRMKVSDRQVRRTARRAARQEESRRREAEQREEDYRRLSSRIEEKRKRIAREAEAASKPAPGPARIPRRAVSGDKDLLAPVLPVLLQRAIRAEELMLYYQPTIECNSGDVVGVEALLRWKRPSHGVLLPAEFLPGLRRPAYSDVLIPLTEWVFRAACRQAKEWKEAGHGAVRVAVNVPPSLPQAVDLAVEIIEDSGLDRSALELELSEDIIGPSSMAETMRSSAEQGIRWWVDNFGAGRAGLDALTLPVVGLKMPPSLVRGIGTGRVDAVIGPLITMAHEIGLRVCAVGVERAEQYEFLREHGCDEAQGYFFSEPVPAESVEFETFA